MLSWSPISCCEGFYYLAHLFCLICVSNFEVYNTSKSTILKDQISLLWFCTTRKRLYSAVSTTLFVSKWLVNPRGRCWRTLPWGSRFFRFDLRIILKHSQVESQQPPLRGRNPPMGNPGSATDVRTVFLHANSIFREKISIKSDCTGWFISNVIFY